MKGKLNTGIPDFAHKHIDRLFLYDAVAHCKKLSAQVLSGIPASELDANLTLTAKEAFAECVRKENNKKARQGRRGAPASPIMKFIPALAYLKECDVSDRTVWRFFRIMKVPVLVPPESGKRRIDRARSPISKIGAAMSDALAADNADAFAEAYHKLQMLMQRPTSGE